MMKLAIVWCVCLFLSWNKVFAQDNLSALVPIPAQVKNLSGKNVRIADMVIVSNGLSNEADVLCQIIKKRTNNSLQIRNNGNGTKKAIHLLVDKTIKEPEGYCLEVVKKGVTIRGGSPAGVFYGIMTLDQLLLGDVRNTQLGEIAPVLIEDAPRYGYRSLMLDPARHFIPLEDVRFYIDQMAKYKFNVLQLHLTDDQGWRMEIKKYPLLTTVGAMRNSKSGNNGPDNGFYTQQQLKELVCYAAQKHVEIVPEFDIPGHTVAALAAYPQLGCTVTDTLPKQVGKTVDMMLCAGNEQVYQFCTDIIEEICAVFPSRRIHFGGDEAAIAKNWQKCEKCQALMKKQNYHKERELMGYFFKHINEQVLKNGRQALLWCELDHVRMPANEFLFDYPKEAMLFTWRLGLTPKCIELTGDAGIKLIMSPGEHCYLDYPQLNGDLPEFNNWGMPVLTLKDAYLFDPGYGLPADKQAHIMGVAGLLWGEAMKNIHRVNYMTYPRALALAEAGWSRMENRSWESFKNRLYPNLSDLMKEGVNLRVPYEIK